MQTQCTARCSQRVAQRFSDVCTHCKRNVPHVARNVWSNGYQMFVLFEVVINEPTFPLSHTLLATCGTLPFHRYRHHYKF